MHYRFRLCSLKDAWSNDCKGHVESSCGMKFQSFFSCCILRSNIIYYAQLSRILLSPLFRGWQVCSQLACSSLSPQFPGWEMFTLSHRTPPVPSSSSRTGWRVPGSVKQLHACYFCKISSFKGGPGISDVSPLSGISGLSPRREAGFFLMSPPCLESQGCPPEGRPGFF